MRVKCLLLSLTCCLLGCADDSSREKQPQGEVAHPASALQAPSDFLQKVVYSKEDSAEVVRLLRLSPDGSDVLFYARCFLNVPYVANTLEVSDPERIVVNLRELDCTTLVETVLALTMTRRQGADNFVDYCRNLEKLRYRNGKCDGYVSRLHYFEWWINDNMKKGVVENVDDGRYFTGKKRIDNSYMSMHPGSYKMLRLHPEWVSGIREMEKMENNNVVSFLPEKSTCLDCRKLQNVHDGDIVAIVTNKSGLDYSHLGFSVWGRDGKLHLLNASSIHKKVVEEPMTLYQYLAKHPKSIGIRVLRLR